jgi:hypothetical protein
MAAMLKSYFDRLLEQGLPREATINFGSIGIMQQDLATLELPFMEEEVWHTLKDLPSDKSPGPDGMTGAFFKTAWLVIKLDVDACDQRLLLGGSSALPLPQRSLSHTNPQDVECCCTRGLSAHKFDPQLPQIGLQTTGEPTCTAA